MISFPTAKINIGLHILAKRSDGYHDIETVFYPTGFSDALEIVVNENPLNKDILSTSGFEIGVPPEENIVMKAMQRLRKSHTFPFIRIHLHKAIPSGSGLGGGSSDAVCLLKSVNKLFSLGISENELKSLSLGLGSDCPFFIEQIPSVAYGRGEILNPVPPVLDGFRIVILHPDVGISTREAYENCKPRRPSASLPGLITKPITEWKGLIFNDFEDFAFKKQPLIGELKMELYRAGAVFSLMSGSGSAVFGIFNEKPVLSKKVRKYLVHESTF
jgi:4-diphosphocytidyl-2-C-methyl-D-erythritol kinase